MDGGVAQTIELALETGGHPMTVDALSPEPLDDPVDIEAGKPPERAHSEPLAGSGELRTPQRCHREVGEELG